METHFYFLTVLKNKMLEPTVQIHNYGGLSLGYLKPFIRLFCSSCKPCPPPAYLQEKYWCKVHSPAKGATSSHTTHISNPFSGVFCPVIRSVGLPWHTRDSHNQHRSHQIMNPHFTGLLGIHVCFTILP